MDKTHPAGSSGAPPPKPKPGSSGSRPREVPLHLSSTPPPPLTAGRVGPAPIPAGRARQIAGLFERRVVGGGSRMDRGGPSRGDLSEGWEPVGPLTAEEQRAFEAEQVEFSGAEDPAPLEEIPRVKNARRKSFFNDDVRPAREFRYAVVLGEYRRIFFSKIGGLLEGFRVGLPSSRKPSDFYKQLKFALRHAWKAPLMEEINRLEGEKRLLIRTMGRADELERAKHEIDRLQGQERELELRHAPREELTREELSRVRISLKAAHEEFRGLEKASLNPATLENRKRDLERRITRLEADIQALQERRGDNTARREEESAKARLQSYRTELRTTLESLKKIGLNLAPLDDEIRRVRGQIAEIETREKEKGIEPILQRAERLIELLNQGGDTRETYEEFVTVLRSITDSPQLMDLSSATMRSVREVVQLLCYIRWSAPEMFSYFRGITEMTVNAYTEAVIEQGDQPPRDIPLSAESLPRALLQMNQEVKFSPEGGGSGGLEQRNWAALVHKFKGNFQMSDFTLTGGNVPNRQSTMTYTDQDGASRTIVYGRHGSPTTAGGIGKKEEIVSDYEGFLRAAEEKGEGVFYVVHQWIGQKKIGGERDRVQEIYGLQKSHENLFVLVQPMDGDFFKGTGAYETLRNIDGLKDQILREFYPEEASKGIKPKETAAVLPMQLGKEYKEVIERLADDVHSIFFEGKTNLSKEEWQTFLLFFYVFQKIDLKFRLGGEAFPIRQYTTACKEFIDRGGVMALLENMVHLYMTGQEGNPEELKILIYNLLGPTLANRGYAVVPGRLLLATNALEYLNRYFQEQGEKKEELRAYRFGEGKWRPTSMSVEVHSEQTGWARPDLAKNREEYVAAVKSMVGIPNLAPGGEAFLGQLTAPSLERIEAELQKRDNTYAFPANPAVIDGKVMGLGTNPSLDLASGLLKQLQTALGEKPAAEVMTLLGQGVESLAKKLTPNLGFDTGKVTIELVPEGGFTFEVETTPPRQVRLECLFAIKEKGTETLHGRVAASVVIKYGADGRRVVEIPWRVVSAGPQPSEASTPEERRKILKQMEGKSFPVVEGPILSTCSVGYLDAHGKIDREKLLGQIAVDHLRNSVTVGGRELITERMVLDGTDETTNIQRYKALSDDEKTSSAWMEDLRALLRRLMRKLGGDEQKALRVMTLLQQGVYAKPLDALGRSTTTVGMGTGEEAPSRVVQDTETHIVMEIVTTGPNVQFAVTAPYKIIRGWEGEEEAKASITVKVEVDPQGRAAVESSWRITHVA